MFSKGETVEDERPLEVLLRRAWRLPVSMTAVVLVARVNVGRRILVRGALMLFVARAVTTISIIAIAIVVGRATVSCITVTRTGGVATTTRERIADSSATAALDLSTRITLQQKIQVLAHVIAVLEEDVVLIIVILLHLFPITARIAHAANLALFIVGTALAARFAFLAIVLIRGTLTARFAFLAIVLIRGALATRLALLLALVVIRDALATRFALLVRMVVIVAAVTTVSVALLAPLALNSICGILVVAPVALEGV